MAGFDPNTATPVDASAPAAGGFDPSSAKPAVNFSDDALRSASGRPGTTVVYMHPAQYLAMTPEMKSNPVTDKKGKSLKASLDNGDDVHEVPSLEVVVDKSGHARVSDQDGRHRAQFAADNGVDLIPVAVQRFGDKAPIKSVTGMRAGAQPVAFDFKPATIPPPAKGEAAAASPPPKPGLLDKIKDAIYVPKDKRQDKTVAAAVSAGASDEGNEIGRQFKAAGSDLVASLTPPKTSAEALDRAGGNLIPGFATRQLGDIASMALSPLTGALTSEVGRPVEAATGINRNVTGNALAALVPIGGEVKAAKALGDAADAVKGADAAKDAKTVEASAGTAGPPSAADFSPAEKAAHSAKVARLRAEGVEPTAGQAQGGVLRRFEEGHKSDPLVGTAIRSHEDHAVNTFNRALYNRVLEPLDISLKPGVPVGRNSVKAVGDMVGKAYDHLKPGMNLAPDDEGLSDLAAIRTRVGELPPAQQGQFESILNNRVLHRLDDKGGMDGDTFKLTESDISRLSRDYKSSPDPAQRHLGDALSDVNDALRANLERTSAPGIRADLQKVNKSWAMLTRLEDAATARKGSNGVITPGDLLGSVKKMDKTVRKRQFARGDAMLQQFAEDAADVLGNKLPDSGTAERLAINHHGLTMYLGGKLTNPVADLGMNMLKNAQAQRAGRMGAANIPSPQNALIHPELLRRAPALNFGGQVIPNLATQGQGQ